MVDSKEQLRQQVEKNVNKSGYAVELYIHSLLNNRNNIVYSNDYFFDYDEDKPRTIDLVVRSLETFSIGGDYFPLLITMPIECKKSDNNAWVFFANKDYLSISVSGQIVDYRHILTRDFDAQSSVLWDYDKN